jgi:chloride channel 2
LIRNNLLAAAMAAGVSATFGAPFGGVLFSIEVTSTYYRVSTLWRSIFCTLFGSFFFYLLKR